MHPQDPLSCSVIMDKLRGWTWAFSVGLKSCLLEDSVLDFLSVFYQCLRIRHQRLTQHQRERWNRNEVDNFRELVLHKQGGHFLNWMLFWTGLLKHCFSWGSCENADCDSEGLGWVGPEVLSFHTCFQVMPVLLTCWPHCDTVRVLRGFRIGKLIICSNCSVSFLIGCRHFTCVILLNFHRNILR